jgi:hypothetical protein
MTPMLSTSTIFQVRFMIQSQILLGVSFLANFFQDKDSLPGNDVDSDSTTVKPSGCCLHLVWDHGQHVRNFMHGDSALPKIMLYQGNGYFSAFCSRLC